MKLMSVALLIVTCCICEGCSPVTLQKCQTDFKYDSNGKLISQYQECLTQTPEKILPLHLKHQELYE